MLTLWPIAGSSPEKARFDSPILSGRSHHRWLILPALWAIMLMCGIPSARKAHFDPSLLNLQAQNLESVKLVRKLDTWSAVVLSNDLNMLRKVRSAVIHLPSVESTDSWLGTEDNYNWLQQHQNQIPRINWSAPDAIQTTDLQRLAGKATALADRLRKAAEGSAKAISFQSAATALEKFSGALTGPSTAARLSDWQLIFVDELKSLLARFHPPSPNPSAVPATLREHYIGKHGQYALYLDPKQDLWVQASLQPDSSSKSKPPSPPSPTLRR